MTQVTAINTRQVKKIDGHTIFNIVKTMTGESAAEIMKVIPPSMVPMIGKNDPQQQRYYYARGSPQGLRSSWDSDQQVSWGNALFHLRQWKRDAGNYDALHVNAAKQNKTLPLIFTDWIKNNKPTPWNKIEKETKARDIMADVLSSRVNWTQRNNEKVRLRGLSNQKLEKELFDPKLQLTNAPWAWRNVRTVRERKALLNTQLADLEKKDMDLKLREDWKVSPEAMSQEMLLYVGSGSPQFMMSWIIANTYQQANPAVKNIASKEGSYKYRVWRLSERYYPAMNSNDTLPKTTQKWPRYSSDPKILQVFTLPEIMKYLKSTFSNKQDVMANQQQLAFDDWKVKAEASRNSLLTGSSVDYTMRRILDNGLDHYNRQMMNNSYTYYPDLQNQSYSNRKTVEVDPKDQIILTWPFIEKTIGAKKLKGIINQYEADAKQRYDTITKEAKENYDRAIADVQAARASYKKGTGSKKAKKS
jgi:hypothetical protein